MCEKLYFQVRRTKTEKKFDTLLEDQISSCYPMLPVYPYAALHGQRVFRSYPLRLRWSRLSLFRRSRRRGGGREGCWCSLCPPIGWDRRGIGGSGCGGGALWWVVFGWRLKDLLDGCSLMDSWKRCWKIFWFDCVGVISWSMYEEVNDGPKSSGMSYLYSGLRHSHLRCFYDSVLYLCTIQSYSDVRNRRDRLVKMFMTIIWVFPLICSGTLLTRRKSWRTHCDYCAKTGTSQGMIIPVISIY